MASKLVDSEALDAALAQVREFIESPKNFPVIELDLTIGERCYFRLADHPQLAEAYDNWRPFIILFHPTNQYITTANIEVLVVRNPRFSNKETSFQLPLCGNVYWGGGYTTFVGSVVCVLKKDGTLDDMIVDTKII